MNGAETVALVVSAASVGIAIPAIALCFYLAKEVVKLKQRSFLRLDGTTLHGRVVFVDDLGWEREIARWGLDSNGRFSSELPSDYTIFSGYLIEGPDDVPTELRTAEDAYRR